MPQLLKGIGKSPTAAKGLGNSFFWHCLPISEQVLYALQKEVETRDSYLATDIKRIAVNKDLLNNLWMTLACIYFRSRYQRICQSTGTLRECKQRKSMYGLHTCYVLCCCMALLITMMDLPRGMGASRLPSGYPHNAAVHWETSSSLKAFELY